MEETPEGLATAAATREAAKRKRAELEAQGVIDDQPAAKKSTISPQAISHEVALPEGYVCEVDSQPELYGTKGLQCLRLPSSIYTFVAHVLSKQCDRAGSVQQPHWKGKMAKQYPFTLDPFQSTSVACLVRFAMYSCIVLSQYMLSSFLTLQERRESVLVAAHTSAGKTAVAE